jgi:hypothetical protein
MSTRPLALGRATAPSALPGVAATPYALPPDHLLTHGVILGMTGSGKTGLAVTFVEEALRSDVPVLLLDIKGDLANLLLTLPSLAAEEFLPWVDPEAAARAGRSAEALAAELATRWRNGLAEWDLGPADVSALRTRIAPRVITPGSTAGEPLDILSALRVPSALWTRDVDAAREALVSAVSLLLRMVGRDPDPARSRDHVVLSHLAERRLRMGRAAALPELLADLAAPPIATLGVLAMDDFLPPRDRQGLAQDLNTLLASPSFAAWQRGAALDVGAWLRRDAAGRAPAVVLSVAHLDDDERMLVLSVVLEQLLAWTRSLAGTSALRALVLVDEAFGLLPPHPAAPPTKRPLLALLKQARAYGVGLLLATQNPMDLDYKALSNAGVWCVGRLPTDADRARVVEALALGGGFTSGGESLGVETLGTLLRTLPPRSFFVHDVHASPPSAVLQTRWTLSWLRGPMTRHELRALAQLAAPAGHAADGSQFPSGETATDCRPRAVAAPLPEGESSSAGSSAAVHVPAVCAPAGVVAPSAPEGAHALRATGESGAVVPAGWRVWRVGDRGLAALGGAGGLWLVGTAVAHVREPRLGVTRNHTLSFAAPMAPSGQPDLTRAVALEPGWLELEAGTPALTGVDVPPALVQRRATEAAARAMREHAYRVHQVEVLVHRELGLTSATGESAEEFALRCRTEAARRAALARSELETRYAPRVHRLAARVTAARVRLARLEQDAREVPGLVGAALIGMVAGQRNADRVSTARNRALTQCERARRELHDADEALGALVAERDAAQAALVRAAEHAGEDIRARTLAARRTDVELVEIGVARAEATR